MTSSRGFGFLGFALALVVALPACSRREEPVANGAPSASTAAPAAHDATVVPAKHIVSALGSGATGSCASICEQAAKLGCKRADACRENCVAMASTGVCEAELGAFYACLKGQPIAHWECLDDGTASIREGYCENEQAAFARCLQQP